MKVFVIKTSGAFLEVKMESLLFPLGRSPLMVNSGSVSYRTLD